MVRNRNIITQRIRPKNTSTSALVIGSSVPTGMKRYVTFIHVNQNAGDGNGGSKLWFCSNTASSTASTPTTCSASEKLSVTLSSAVGGKKMMQVPPAGPDPDNPLFSIAAGKFFTVSQLSAQAGSTTVDVMVQYYDE